MFPADYYPGQYMRILLLITFFFLISDNVTAAGKNMLIKNQDNIVIPFFTLNTTSPRDRTDAFLKVNSTFHNYSNAISSTRYWGWYDRIITITLPVAGTAPDGALLYSTGIPGLGMTFSFDIAGGRDYPYAPGPRYLGQYFHPDSGTRSVPLNMGIYLVPIGKGIPSGIQKIPPLEVATFCVQGVNNTAGSLVTAAEKLCVPVKLAGGTLTVTPRTCSLDSPFSRTIPLNTVRTGEFTRPGQEITAASVSVAITCPHDSDIQVHAVLTDINAPSVTADYLSLSGDSTAKGLAIKLYQNGSDLIRLAPASTAADAPGQFPLAQSPGTDRSALPLLVKYVRINKVLPGSVKAQVGITLSFQ
ncbi:fimbrial protein [Salmonella enterica subsp. enterica]|nr:fimbrial protein [Salmonella enterica subsp. enterica serovar Javiana]EDW0165460.1 fimbrial protein [Salmonella enterica subsp. enterica serovar Javiana]